MVRPFWGMFAAEVRYRAADDGSVPTAGRAQRQATGKARPAGAPLKVVRPAGMQGTGLCLTEWQSDRRNHREVNRPKTSPCRYSAAGRDSA